MGHPSFNGMASIFYGVPYLRQDLRHVVGEVQVQRRVAQTAYFMDPYNLSFFSRKFPTENSSLAPSPQVNNRLQLIFLANRMPAAET